MSYNKSPFKMAPKSPLTKALKGNQGKLPQHLQEAIKAAPESPAKAMTGPGIRPEAGKTGMGGENSAKGVNAKPKWDKDLNTLVAARKGLKKGTAEYNTIQNKINAKMGSKKVHGRGTSTKTSMSTATATKTAKIEAPKVEAPKVNTATTPKPAAQKPAAQKPAASKGPSQADKFENALAKENAKGPMGSETGSKAPAKKPSAKKPVVAKKPVAKKTVGQKVKGTVRKARLAQLDRKATRQAAKAADKKSKGAGKLSGLGSPKSPAKKNYDSVATERSYAPGTPQSKFNPAEVKPGKSKPKPKLTPAQRKTLKAIGEKVSKKYKKPAPKLTPAQRKAIKAVGEKVSKMPKPMPKKVMPAAKSPAKK
jgi:hypothetical protein